MPITVNYLAVLCNRHVDARAAFSIGNFDGLRHCVRVFAAVFHRLEAKSGPIPARVLGTLFWRHLFKFMGEFHRGVSLQFPSPKNSGLALLSSATPRCTPQRLSGSQAACPSASGLVRRKVVSTRALGRMPVADRA